MTIVQKYGGTSLADCEKIGRAARRMAALNAKGARVVAVVSAQGDTTDVMIEKAGLLSRNPSPREMDAYLSTGEQMSAGLMAMALEELGCPAISLTGAQAGIRTDGVHGGARILEIDCRRIREELDAGRVVVVAGFQGTDGCGNITTLGRGGSDTTAVALAAWLDADLCQIFTDVDGIYDRDPRKEPGALRFSGISYGDMLALVDKGAQVLHRPSVELARDRGIRVEVRSSITGAPGTIVG